MKRQSSARQKTLYLVGLATVLMGLMCSDVCADTDSPEIRASKDKVVKDLCSDGGRLAKCAFQPAQDCPKIARDLVDLCAEPSVKNLQFDPEKAFELCFWKEYLRRFPKLDSGADCHKPRGGNPLQPLPPEMEREYQPVVAAEATAAARVTPQKGSHHED